MQPALFGLAASSSGPYIVVVCHHKNLKTMSWLVTSNNKVTVKKKHTKGPDNASCIIWACRINIWTLVRMVLTTARASITPCLFVFTHTFFVLFLFPFLFFFVLICMLGGIFNEKEPGFGLV